MSNMIKYNRVVFTIVLLAIQKQFCEVERGNSLDVTKKFYACDKGACLQRLSENLLDYVYIPL